MDDVRRSGPTVGVLLGSTTDFRDWDLCSGVMEVIGERGANLLVFPHSWGGEDVLDLVGAENVDGLVTFLYQTRQEFEELCERYRPLPVVSVMRFFPGHPGVGTDNYQSMREVIRHLVEDHGYRRVAFIRGEVGNPSADERYRAYAELVREYDLPVGPEMVFEGVFSYDVGRAAVRHWLDELGLEVEAIVASTDTVARGALDELRERGIIVPDDVAVTGFDDIPESSLSMPPLTTVTLPTREMGRWAAEVLLARIEGKEVPERVLVPARPVFRRSCGCLGSAVVNAVAGAGPAADGKEAVVEAMARALEPFPSGRTMEIMERLYDAFWSDLDGGDGQFLSLLDLTLRRELSSGEAVARWQDMVSALRGGSLPQLGGDRVVRAEGLCQGARALITEIAVQVGRLQIHRWQQSMDVIREVGYQIVTAFDMERLGDLLVRELPSLGIDRAALVVYEGEGGQRRARLLAACDGNVRIEVADEEMAFHPRALLPDQVWRKWRRYALLLTPLASDGRQLGFVLLDLRARDGMVYDVLRIQLSSALRGALLLHEHERVVEALGQEQYLLRTLLEHIPAHVYFKDRESRFIRVSRALARWFGLDDPAQAVGKTDFDFFSEEHARQAFEDEQRIIRTGEPILGLEEKETWPDGRVTWVSTSKLPMYDEQGNIVGTFGISVDITARKEMEEELRRSERLLRSVIDATPDWIFIKDREHRYQMVNRGFADALHMEPEDFIGKDDLELGFPEEVVKGNPEKGIRGFWTDDCQVIESGEPLVNPYDPAVVDGVTRIFHTIKVPLSDGEGNVWGVLGFSRDVTERERVLAELERRSVQLRTAIEVSRAASSVLETEELIWQVVELIRERFDFYYVGLFMVDESGEWTGEPGRWAVLRAGTGEAGRIMLERGHKLEIGGNSMIGQCVANMKARIALDVGEEAVRFDNPLLPETRSEMALPLAARGQVIGALTVQDSREAAFSEEDVAILQAMADQLAVAIENARLFEQTQDALARSDRLYTISRDLGAAADEESLLRAMAHPAIDAGAMGVDLAYVDLDDNGEPEWLEIVATWHREGRSPNPVGTRFRIVNFPISYLWLSNPNEALLIADVATDERVDDNTRQLLALANCRATAIIPLTQAGRWVAVAVFTWREPHEFSGAEEEIYNALIGLASPAVASRRLLLQTQEALEETWMLYEMGRQLSMSLDEREVMLRVLEQVARTGVERAMIGLYEGPPDGEPEWLNVVAVYEPGKGRELVEGQRWPVDAIPTIRYAYERAHEGPLVFNRVAENPPDDEALRASFAERGVQAFVSIPMLWRGRPFAALAVERRSQDHFTAREIRLYQSIANQSVIAVQNARLFAEQRRASELLAGRVRALDCLNDIGRKIEERPPVSEFLSWVAGRIPAAMRHSEVCVAAIEFEGQAYGDLRAVELPWQMVQGIRVGGELLGNIYIAYSEEHDFADEESALMGDIARRVSGYLQSQRLLERVQRSLDETQALYRAGAELSAAQSYADVLEVLRRHTLIGDADMNVSLNLYERPWVGDDMPEWSIVMARWTSLPAEALSPRYPLRAFPSARKLLRPDEPVLITDVEHDRRMDEKARALYVRRFRAKSTIFVPLVARGQWIGYVNAIYGEPFEFPEGAVQRLMALAGQAAVVVQNLWQLEDIQARVRREQLLREITARVRGSTDPEAIVRIAVRELGEALRRRTFIRLGDVDQLSGVEI